MAVGLPEVDETYLLGLEITPMLCVEGFQWIEFAVQRSCISHFRVLVVILLVTAITHNEKLCLFCISEVLEE